MQKLFVVRHGTTDWNNKKLVQGKVDIDLNDEGVSQAEKLKNKLNLKEIDLCICSPMKRAKHTADILIDEKIDIVYDDQLVERNFGEFEGKSLDSDLIFSQWDYALNTNEGGIETIRECLERAKKFIEKIKNEYKDKNLLIISHGAFIKALHFNILGYDEKTDFLSFAPKNATVYEYILK